MATAIRALGVSKEYMLGVFNYDFFYKDLQSWLSKKLGREDPHAKLDADVRGHDNRHFWALKDITFDLEQGERLGVIGINIGEYMKIINKTA